MRRNLRLSDAQTECITSQIKCQLFLSEHNQNSDLRTKFITPLPPSIKLHKNPLENVCGRKNLKRETANCISGVLQLAYCERAKIWDKRADYLSRIAMEVLSGQGSK
jgi:hypothetical protein